MKVMCYQNARSLYCVEQMNLELRCIWVLFHFFCLASTNDRLSQLTVGIHFLEAYANIFYMHIGDEIINRQLLW